MSVRTARVASRPIGDGRPAPAGRAHAADSAVRKLAWSVERVLAATKPDARARRDTVSTLKIGPRCSCRTLVQQDWLVLDADVPERIARRVRLAGGPFGLLRMNRALRGPARLVLVDDAYRMAVRARADIPLADAAGESREDAMDANVVVGHDGFDSRTGDGDGLAGDARMACASLAGAIEVDRRRSRGNSCDAAERRQHRERDRTPGGRPHDAGDVRADDAASDSADRAVAIEPLADLCNDLGWAYSGTDGSELRITLDAPEAGFRQAFVRPAGAGARVLLNLFDDLPGPPDGVTADAIALLLLRVGGLTRLVRPCASKRSAEIGFDVRLPRMAAMHLDHALSSLSVAARACACEVDALAADRRLAEAYATACGLDF